MIFLFLSTIESIVSEENWPEFYLESSKIDPEQKLHLK